MKAGATRRTWTMPQPQSPSPTYPTFDELRSRRLTERRDAAVRAVRAAEKLALEAGGRLVVFGSLAEGGFHERSGIDIALMSIPAGQDTDVALDVELALADAGFVAEIIPERFLSPSLRDRIKERGREPSALG
jgi:predicted nucleotidyltransferase